MVSEERNTKAAPLCCTAGRAAEIRHTTGRVWSATPRGGAAGMTGVSGEERMNASMGEVCGWKIVMVTIE